MLTVTPKERRRIREVAPPSRTIGALLALLLVGSACSGSSEVYEVPPVEGGAAGDQAEEQISLPPPIASVPVYAIHRPEGLSDRHLATLDRAEGAAAIAPLAVRKVSVKGPKGTERLRVASVDPVEFRNVAPSSTRAADFVWLSLLGGDAIVTHDAGKKLGLTSESAEIRVGREGRFRVGALADNGTPNVADVLLSDVSLQEWTKTTAVVVGAETGANLASLRRSVARRVPGSRLTRLIPKSATFAPEIAPGAVIAPTATLAGLHPALASGVHRLLQAAKGRVWLISGYRDAARQAQLWAAALVKYGDPNIADNWVARPGHSFHQAGLAVDLGGDLALAAQIVNELQLPLWRPMSHEPWHFELVGSRG